PVSPSTGVAPVTLSGINGMIEIVGGVLIVLGLFTRPVAFILAGDMAVAYFIAHAPRGFFPLLNAGELAIIYCFVFLYLAVAGGGVWSLDHLRAGNKASRPAWRPHGFTAAVTSWGFRLCSNQPSASHTCPLLGQAETDIPLLIHSRCGARCLAESCIFHPHRADGDGGGCGFR